MEMPAEDLSKPATAEAIAAALRAAEPFSTPIEEIMQRGAQPQGPPQWSLLNATPVPLPRHGGYSGHVLPGVAFVLWGLWWLLGVVRGHAKATREQRLFVARAWYPLFLSPSSSSGEEEPAHSGEQQQRQRRSGFFFFRRCRCRSLLPLEPCLVLALCLLGVNAELWLGHDSFRTLMRGDGYLFQMHLAEWQHTVMYLAFCFSALVSLAAHLTSSSSSSSLLLPRRAPQFALAGAFALEFTLFAFHLEGTALDVRAHSLLLVAVGSCAAFSAAEAFSRKDSPFAVELAAAKSLAVFLQGCWFLALAQILFGGHRAWDPRYHGSVMFLPAVFGFCALGAAVLWLMAFLVGGAVLLKGGGGGKGAVAASPARSRRSRQAYGRLDDDEDDEQQQWRIGAVGAPKSRLGLGGGVLELSAV